MTADEPLVVVKSSDDLYVEPIWENPIDDIEGPLYQEYIQQNPGYTDILLRQTVADMLLAAGQNLPPQYQLIIRAGHRPLDVQLKLLDGVKQQYLAENPGASQEAALEFARTYVSDPLVKVPPHCCGAAVDVDVRERATNELVDFGCPMNTDDDISFLDSDKINTQQKANRDMLVEAMTTAGFAVNPYEWWHFSYGDQTWADTYKKSGPLYGLIEP